MDSKKIIISDANLREELLKASQSNDLLVRANALDLLAQLDNH